MFAGVAGGLADYIGVDPTFVRLGFVAATLFGGFGILAYLVMAVVVPEDDGSGNPVDGRRPPIWALILLGIVALVVLPGPFWGWGNGWWFGIGLFWTGALVLAGAGLYRAIAGRWPGQPKVDSSEAKTTSAKATSSKATSAKAGKSTSAKATSAEAVENDGSPPRFVRLLAIGAIVLVGIGAAFALAALGAWATATGSGAVVAGVVIALGIALTATALIGGTARRSAPWLLGVALVLAVPAGAVAAADVRFDGGIGEREYTPRSVADIPDDGYELGVGRLVVDLRELDWSKGAVVPLRSELGLGQMVVSVPSDVCVSGRAEAKAGEIVVRGEENSGVDPEFDRGAPAADLPRLELDGELQAGQLVVTDRDPDEFEDDRGPGRHDDDDGPDEIAAEPEACK